MNVKTGNTEFDIILNNRFKHMKLKERTNIIYFGVIDIFLIISNILFSFFTVMIIIL